MSIGVDKPLELLALSTLPKDVKREIAQVIRLLSLQIRVEERERAAGILITCCADHEGLDAAIDLLMGRGGKS
jgi:hypothetical protein